MTAACVLCACACEVSWHTERVAVAAVVVSPAPQLPAGARRVAAEDSGKPVVDAAFGEVMVTCEKIAWLLREGERHLRPERRSSGIMARSPCPGVLALQL